MISQLIVRGWRPLFVFHSRVPGVQTALCSLHSLQLKCGEEVTGRLPQGSYLKVIKRPAMVRAVRRMQP